MGVELKSGFVYSVQEYYNQFLVCTVLVHFFEKTIKMILI